MSEIVSKPASDAYRENWDRMARRKRRELAAIERETDGILRLLASTPSAQFTPEQTAAHDRLAPLCRRARQLNGIEP